MRSAEAVSAITSYLSYLSDRIAAMEALLPTVGDNNVLFFKKTGLCVIIKQGDAKIARVEVATQFEPFFDEAWIVENFGVIKNGINERAKLMRYDSVLRIKIREFRKMMKNVQ
jgi:hypothetical protein